MSEGTKGLLILVLIAVGAVWYVKSWQADNAKFCAEKGMTYAPIDRSLDKLCADEHNLIHQFPD